MLCHSQNKIKIKMVSFCQLLSVSLENRINFGIFILSELNEAIIQIVGFNLNLSLWWYVIDYHHLLLFLLLLFQTLRAQLCPTCCPFDNVNIIIKEKKFNEDSMNMNFIRIGQTEVKLWSVKSSILLLLLLPSVVVVVVVPNSPRSTLSDVLFIRRL